MRIVNIVALCVCFVIVIFTLVELKEWLGGDDL
jgi:hypothetical protein